MPSCVVKSCRNHSGYKKKCQGITFHRFPSANDAWKEDWIQIIRESRDKNDWNPSKSSVICSIHFESNDLYVTKRGLLRVVAYAVPKKFLIAPSRIKKEQPADTNTFSPSYEISLVTEAVALSSGQQLTLKQVCSENLTSTLPQFLIAPTGIKKEQPADTNTFSASYECTLLTEAITSSSGQQLPLKQSCSDNSTTTLPQSLSKVVPPSEIDLEQSLTIRCLKRNLMKMHILTQSQKNKIKILNQKIRRLQNRNKSLNNILKTLKDDN